QQAGTGQSDGGSLGEQLTELTGNFVQDLLKQLGVSGGSGKGSGNGQSGRSGQGVSQDEGQQPERPGVNRPRPGNAAQGSGGRGHENVDQLVGGVVDLVSGIVGTVAGKKAGSQTRQALSGLADEVSQAIAAGGKGLDSRGRGMNGTNTSTPVGSGHDGGSPSTPPDAGSGPITCQAIGVCPSQGQPTRQRAGAPQARGPPAEQTSTPTAAKTKSAKTKPTDKPAAQPAAKKAPLPKGISKAQAANAEKIVKVGQKMGIPKRGLQVALAAAFQESGLRNVHHGDRDSLGLFQQRPSQGWGSKAQVLNPTHAATEFFKHLKKVSGWQKKSINDAAQAVQNSGRPHAYAKWTKKASALLDHVLGNTGNTGKTSKKDRTPTPQSASTSGTGTGRGTDRQNDLAGSIQELTGNFVTNLLGVLGIGQQGGQQGGQAGTGQGSTGTGTSNQDNSLASSIQQLTSNFVTNLLDLLGIGQQGGQPGGTGGGTGGAGGGTGGGGQTGGAGGGQDEGWSLGGQDGQFAGTACQSEAECALAGGNLQTRQPATTGNTVSPDRTWWNDDGSATDVNRALNNRLAVLKGQKSLEAAKDQLAAKKITKAAYNKKVAAQKALTTKANQSMGLLSTDDQTLINDTIGDQRKLAAAKTKLDAERKQLAAGKLSKATYKKHTAAYNKQADAVEAQTAQLYDATGHNSLDADPGRNGAGAACTRSGAFGECSTAAIDPKTGKLKEDQSLCMLGISGCSSSAKIGNRTASATCDPTKGCATTSRAGKTTAKAKCGAKDCDLAATADQTGPHTYCQTRNGRCDNDSSERHAKTDKKGKNTTTDRRALSGTANCRVNGGQCTTATGPGDDNETLSYVNVACQTKGCKGTGATATKAQITAGVNGKTATRTTGAHHDCTVGATTGGCSTDSSSTVANNTADIELAAANTATKPAKEAKTAKDKKAAKKAKAESVPQWARGLTASSRTTGTVTCDSPDCKGSEKGATTAGASGDIKAKDSKGATRCEVHGIGGTCGSAADSEVSYRAAQTGPGGKKIPAGVVSVSHADSQVRCEDSKTCGGKARTETSARDLAVSKHWRGASTDADCTVRGGGCQGQASSDASTTTDHVRIDPKTGKPLKGQPGSGPTATSRAAASVDCQSKKCSGTAHTASAAFDGAVNNGKPRTSQGTVKCAAGAQSCQVQTLSNATTGPGAAAAYSDKPNANRFGSGPSAASTIGGKLTGTGGGRLSGEVTATNPTVSDAARGNRAEGYCSGTGGTCTAVINGAASSSPDANSIAPMVADQPTSNATTTNTPTGDNGQDTGDQGNPTGKNAKNAKGTKNGKNATASQQNPDQPGQGGQRPDQPATAPGSAASSGGPTVPGASSWTSAWANLNCDGTTGRCKGTPHSSATGLAADKHNTSGTGNKGPPATHSKATGTTTARCDTTASACQATTGTTAGTGQVVADIFKAQNKDQAKQVAQQAKQAKQAAKKAKQAAAAPGATAKQRKAATKAAKTAAEATKSAAAATKAAKKPLRAKDIPVTWSESTATAQCAGPRCKATTTGKAALADDAASGSSGTRATCSSHGGDGCGVAATSTVSTGATSGQPASTKKNAKDLPGRSGTLRTSASLDCPSAGCTGKVTGDAAGKAIVSKPNSTKPPGSKPTGTGGKTRSNAHGKAACTGKADCQAGITSSSVLSMADAKTGQSGSASAAIQVSCQAGGKGCPASATSTSGAKTDTAHANSRATCANSNANGCVAGTVGMLAGSLTQASAQCLGTGCATRLTGSAAAHGAGGVSSASKANSASRCTAKACSGQVRAGATETSAVTGASCSSEGGKCSYRFSASSAGGSDNGGNHAAANARCGTSGGNGGGWCGTTASAKATSNSAVAAAGCQGSANAGCSYHYSARSGASAPGAQASADGHGGGKTGSGHVMTMAQAQGGGGGASASSACQGSAGTTCHHSYSATASASAKDKKTGSHAEAYAHGSGGGGMGSGGVAVAASAFAKGNAAGASASCSGAANCTAHYSATAVDHKKIDGGTGYYEATHRVPCGGSGNGGCTVVSNAVPGPAGDSTGGKKGQDYCSGHCLKPTGSNEFHKYTTVGSANLVPGRSNAPPGSDAWKALHGKDVPKSHVKGTKTEPLDRTWNTTMPDGKKATDVVKGTGTYTTYKDGSVLAQEKFTDRQTVTGKNGKPVIDKKTDKPVVYTSKINDKAALASAPKAPQKKNPVPGGWVFASNGERRGSNFGGSVPNAPTGVHKTANEKLIFDNGFGTGNRGSRPADQADAWSTVSGVQAIDAAAKKQAAAIQKERDRAEKSGADPQHPAPPPHSGGREPNPRAQDPPPTPGSTPTSKPKPSGKPTPAEPSPSPSGVAPSGDEPGHDGPKKKVKEPPADVRQSWVELEKGVYAKYWDPKNHDPKTGANNLSAAQKAQADAAVYQKYLHQAENIYLKPNANATNRAITGGRGMSNEEKLAAKAIDQQTFKSFTNTHYALLDGDRQLADAAGLAGKQKRADALAKFKAHPEDKNNQKRLDAAFGLDPKSHQITDGKLKGWEPAYRGSPDGVNALRAAANEPGLLADKSDQTKYPRDLAKKHPDQFATLAAQFDVKSWKQYMSWHHADWVEQGAAAADMTKDENGHDRYDKAKEMMGGVYANGSNGKNVDILRTYLKDPKSGEWTPWTMFRVKQKDGSYQYIDVSGAHFSSEKDYRENNELPEDARLLLPKNMGGHNGEVVDYEDVSAHHTPTHKKVLGWVAFGAAVVGMVATGIATGGAALAVEVPAFVGAVGTTLTVASGAYFAYEGVHDINSRAAHGQDTSLSNPTVFMDVLSIVGGGAMGIGGGLRLGAIGLTKFAAPIGRGAAAAKSLNTMGTAVDWVGTGAFGTQFATQFGLTVANWGGMSGAEKFDAVTNLAISGAMFGLGAGSKKLGGKLATKFFGGRDGPPPPPPPGAGALPGEGEPISATKPLGPRTEGPPG
ncbi:DUF4781 domain-containing protein, partial [Pseudonocardia acaciae]|uniref:DUF4781 domain-containing protein n=1 Tax=Pseudonocardia acaciae TaxID=551276 RepID=UPI00055DB43D